MLPTTKRAQMHVALFVIMIRNAMQLFIGIKRRVNKTIASSRVQRNPSWVSTCLCQIMSVSQPIVQATNAYESV